MLMVTENIGGIVKDIAVDLGSCKTTRRLPHPSSSALRLLMSKLDALELRSEATLLVTLAAFNLWLLQVAVPANSSERPVHWLVSGSPRPIPMRRLRSRTGIVMVLSNHQPPWHSTYLTGTQTGCTTMGQTRSCTPKLRGRTGRTRGITPLVVPGQGKFTHLALSEAWLCMIGNRCRESESRTRMVVMGDERASGVLCAAELNEVRGTSTGWWFRIQFLGSSSFSSLHDHSAK